MAEGELRRRDGVVMLAGLGAGAALQARFVVEPLTSDEAGGVVVARAWATSGTLYERAWMDRPQGLLVLHRWWDALSSDPRSLRIWAIVAVAVCALATGSIAAAMFGARARARAVLMTSVVMASPALEGYVTNAGLVSMAVSLPCLALAVAVLFRDRPSWWLGLAGAGCAAAMTVKQSAVDAPVTVVLVLVAAAVTARPAIGGHAVRITWFVLGVLGVAGVAAAHGVTDAGWTEYWNAVAGYHLAERSGISNPRLSGLIVNAAVALPAMAVMLGSAIAAVKVRGLARPGPPGTFLSVWFAAASLGAFAGGNFHRHYFLLVIPPIAVAVAGALVRWRARLPRWASARTVAVTCVLWALPFLVWPHLALGGPPRDNASVAKWVREAEVEAGRELSVYAMCSSAGLYAALGRIPDYRYLWKDNVELMDRARTELSEYFSGARAPDIVARYQDCDVEPTVTEVLSRDYEEVAQVGDVVILRSR